MVQVQCFCGVIKDKLEDLVDHKISTHSIKDKNSMSPIVFDMIEKDNQSAHYGDQMTESERQAIKDENKKKYENMRRRAENLLEIKYEINDDSKDPLALPNYEYETSKPPAPAAIKEPVPEDLLELIMETNPDRRVRFVMSQRLVPELVVEDYVMKKKRGPWLHILGGRAVSWKCTEAGCPYICSTLEGSIRGEVREHNHPPDPDVLVKKEARALIRQNVNIETDNSQLARDLLASFRPEVRDSLGSEDSFRQVARRIKRRMREEQSLEELAGYEEVVYDDVKSLNTWQNEEDESAVRDNDDEVLGSNEIDSFMANNIEVVLLDEELFGTESDVTSENPKMASYWKDTPLLIGSQNMFMCNTCPANFKFHHNLNEHERNFHGGKDPFYCNKCSMIFLTHDLLKSHIMMHTGDSLISCKECGMVCKENKSLQIHSASHLSCKSCTKTFLTPKETEKHMLTHVGERPFPCTECGIEFPSETILKRHMNTHTINKMNDQKHGKFHIRKKFKAKWREIPKTGSHGKKVKRPLNAFMVFCGQERNKISCGGLKQSREIFKELGRRWTGLLQEEKVPYFQEAERLKLEHRDERNKQISHLSTNQPLRRFGLNNFFGKL